MNNFTKTDILDEIERICNYSEIKSKKLICLFLRFVVQETLSGRGDQLKGYLIGTQVLGKDSDFDPEQDSLVRIHAGRLRRLLKLYYLEDGKNDPIIIEIPKGSYQPLFSKNDPGTSQIENGASPAVFSPETPAHEPSVAVLPFYNLTGDPNKEHFSHGFSNELSVELTKYNDLKVINCWLRPSLGDIPIPELYNKFGARFLIDGSVHLYENQIKILVILVDTSTGKQIWAERYIRDFTVENLQKIEEEVCDEIAKQSVVKSV